jgi:hypothetical protein
LRLVAKSAPRKKTTAVPLPAGYSLALPGKAALPIHILRRESHGRSAPRKVDGLENRFIDGARGH